MSKKIFLKSGENESRAKVRIRTGVVMLCRHLRSRSATLATLAIAGCPASCAGGPPFRPDRYDLIPYKDCLRSDSDADYINVNIIIYLFELEMPVFIAANCYRLCSPTARRELLGLPALSS
jgi:hypothetical protein